MLDYNTLHGKYGKKRSTGAAQTDAPASAKKDTVGLIDYDALRKKYGTGKKRQSKPAEAPHTTAAKKEALRLMESGALTPTAVMRRKLGVPVEQQSKTILRESEKVNRQVKAAESEVRRDARDRDKAAGGYAAAFGGAKTPEDKHPVASTYAAARGAVQTEEQKATAEKAAALGRLMNQQNDLARAYYFTENEEQRGRISRDTTMQGKQKGVGDLQSVISMAIKVAADAQNPGSGGEPAHIQQFKERLAREYGITQAAINNYALYGDDDSVPADGRYTNISQFIHQLEREQQRLSDEMTAEGYDYNRMAEYQQRLKNATEAKVRAEEREKAAKEDPGMASLGSVFARALQPLDYAGAALSGLGRSDPSKPKSYVPIDPAAMDTTNAVNTVRGTVAKMAEEKWGPVGSFAYQTGMSMADFLFTAGITGNFSGGGKTAANLSLGIMGSNAAADTTVSALNRGLSNRQALTLGAIAGAAEIVTEKVSLETLLDMTSLSKSRMGYVLQNIIAEGSEEATSDVINWTADVLVSRDKSEWRQAIAAYQAQGMDENTAFWHALGDQAVEIGVDFLGGAASGGIMAGGSVAIDSHYDRAAGRDFRQSMNNADGLYQAAIDTGLESGADSDAHRLATRYQQKLDKKGALSDGQLGRLYRANIAAIEAEGDVDTPAMQNPAEGAEMPSTAINTDTATHTPEQQAAIEAYQADADETLKEVFQGYLENPNQGFSRHNISSVSQRQAQDAQRLLGGDYAGYRNAINSNGIQHILGEHGPSGTVDHSLADLNDIARMGHVLDNYDNVELVTYESGDTDYSREFRDKNDRPAPMLKFSKRVDGTYYVVEAIPESKYKKFWVVSAYMEKADGGTQAPDANGPRTTPNASLASSPSASTDSIPQTAQDVNKRRSHEAEVLKPHAIAKMGLGANGKTGLVNAIDTRRELGMFSDTMTEENLVEGYIDVYLAGLNGATLEQGGLPLTAGVQAEKLSPTERMQAYYNGVNDAQARVEANKRAANFAKVAGTEKGLVWDSYVETDLLPETADRINELAKRLNVRVTFADSVDGGQANGQINGADIVIAKDAENPALVVFGHEVGHWLEETAPEQYQAFRQFAEQRYHTEILERMAQYELAGKELDYDGALREFVNDDIGRLIGDTDALNDFINENRENRTLLQRFADALRTLWKKLTGKDRQQVKTAEEALVAALRASEAQAAKLEKAGQVQDFSQETADAGARYSIGYDVNNTPFVTVEDDILNGVPKSEWVKTVKENLREKFPEGVTVARSRIDIDKTTQRETTWSKYTQWLRESSPDVYADKMRALGSVDEILRASQGYINEEPNHPRKDDIIDFARGTVQLRIGENDYTAEVVVGGRKDGSMVLYDVLNLAKTTIKEKSQARQTANPSPGTGRNTVTASGDTVTHPGEDVKPNYSLKGTEHAERMVELEKENAALQAKYEQAMKQTRRSDAGKVSEAQVGRYAKVLMDHVGVKGDAKALGLKLQTMYDAVASGKDLDGAEFTYRDFRQMANDIAGDLVSRAVLQDNTMYEDYAALRAHIRDTRIVVDAETRESITDYADFRKRNMGRLRLAHGETGNIDLVYNELSREYPGLFDPELSYGQDQLERIAEVMEMVYARKEFNPWAGDMARATQTFANEIMEQFWDLPGQEATFADRQWRQREALKRRHMAEIQDTVRHEREKWKVQEQKLKKWYADKAAEQRAYKAESEARNRLLKLAARMKRMPVDNTNKTLIRELVGDLDTEARHLTGKKLTELTELRRWYEGKTTQGSDTYDPDFILDQRTADNLKRLEMKHIDDMTLQDVKDLTQVLLNLENEIRTSKRLVGQEEARDVYQLGEQTIDDLRAVEGKKKQGVAAALDKHIVTETLSPLRQVRRMVGYKADSPLVKLTEGLADGQRKMMDYQMRAGKPFERFAQDKAFTKGFSGQDAKTVKITGWVKGKLQEVEITPAMRVSLWLHSQNDQNLLHMRDGGVRVPDLDLYRKGKLADAYAAGTVVKLSPDVAKNLWGQMTQTERAFARETQKYFREVSQPAINEVSRQLKGYDIAEVENYFPIRTDKTFGKAELETLKFDGTIEGMGFLKERQNFAHNPMYLEDVNTVVEQAIRMHGKYVGLAIPVRNFGKVWNVSTAVAVEGSQGSTVDKAAKSTSLVDLIRKTIPQMQDMNPVAEVKGNELPAGKNVIDRLTTFIGSIGDKVHRTGFGDVLFSKGRIKNSMLGHGMGTAKIETFAAVPNVIKYGKQADFQENWKGRGYDTYTFTAPVTYRGETTYLGVIVTKDVQDGRYYVHEVVDADGNLIFGEQENTAAASDGRASLSGTVDTVATTVFKDSISQEGQGVKWVSYGDSVQNAVQAVWGKTGYDYITKLMTDLQGGGKQASNWAKTLNKVRSNYAGAVLTLNASVAVKQAASYPTAAAVLGWGPLVKAMGDIGHVDLDLIAKYTPLQWYRSKGFATKELGDIQNYGGLMKDVLSHKALNWIQGIDLATTRKLWKASEYYVRENSPSLKTGTEEYYRAVADIYNRVIEETQPNYTTMQRPQLLRSDDTLMGNLAMFKTQPFQNFNILYDAAGEYRAVMERAKAGEATKAEIKTARTNLSRAVTSQVGQLAVFAAMTMAWGMFRGRKKYKDEKGNIDWQEILDDMGKNMLSGAASMVPFGTEVYEFGSSKLFGERYYGMEPVTVEAIGNAATSLSKLGDTIWSTTQSVLKGEDVDWKGMLYQLDDSADDISKVAGVPYENVTNLFNAVARWVLIRAKGKYLGEYAALHLTTNAETKQAPYMDLLYDAMEHDRAAYDAIWSQMVKDGFDQEKIKNAMESRMKKAQGVTKAEEMDERYVAPDDREVYERAIEKLTGSTLGKKATEQQLKDAKADAYKFATRGGGEKDQERWERWEAAGMDAGTYALYQLAEEMADKPNENGNLGTITNEEREAAIRSMGLSRRDSAAMWVLAGGKEKSNPWR